MRLCNIARSLARHSRVRLYDERNTNSSTHSFGFPLFAPAMYAALGVGWGDTLLAFVAIIVGCPA